LTILTLGLFTLVVNALMLMLTGWLTGGAISTDNFLSALIGALIVSVVSTVLSWFLVEQK
jgi:putative membrane protein